MARKARFTLPDIPQHIVQRGNNRQPCFHSLTDRQHYLDILHESARSNRAKIHAYVLMTNQVHLLMTPEHAFSIMHTMQDLGRKYVRYFNHKYQRSGTLWEGRYKSSLVETNTYLITCMRYIETKPVRASIVATPQQYHWSSYACNALGRNNKLIQPHIVYTGLGNNPVSRYYAYKTLSNTNLSETELADVRSSLNQQLVLGSDAFKDRIQTLCKRPTRLMKTGRPGRKDKQNIYTMS